MDTEAKYSDILTKLNEDMPRFSKGQKKIASFIISSYEKAAFMTAAKLGDIVGVSESTVVRFAYELGYDGYPGLQEELSEFIKRKLTSVQRIEVSSDMMSGENIIRNVMLKDLVNLKKAVEDIDEKVFGDAVDKIVNAQKIYILGVRSSAALASFMGFYFNLIFDNIRLVHTTSVSEMFEQIIQVTPNDVVIGISFPRYSSRTVKAMQFAREVGATVIAITDNIDSPPANSASMALTARSGMASFVDSLVAPLSLINALIVAVGMKRKDQVSETFSRLEKIWEEYQVY
jgi:DNA-binding MurR/RpiR family transcriptional regulator